jgi:hypothetical protein
MAKGKSPDFLKKGAKGDKGKTAPPFGKKGAKPDFKKGKMAPPFGKK